MLNASEQYGNTDSDEDHLPASFEQVSGLPLLEKERRDSLIFLISNVRCVLNVVFFLLDDFPTSEFYMPTFRNTVCSIFIGGVSIIPAYTAYEDGTECSEMSVHKIQTPGNQPKERTQQCSACPELY